MKKNEKQYSLLVSYWKILLLLLLRSVVGIERLNWSAINN